MNHYCKQGACPYINTPFAPTTPKPIPLVQCIYNDATTSCLLDVVRLFGKRERIHLESQVSKTPPCTNFDSGAAEPQVGLLAHLRVYGTEKNGNSLLHMIINCNEQQQHEANDELNEGFKSEFAALDIHRHNPLIDQ
jgi:hypothetical protein